MKTVKNLLTLIGIAVLLFFLLDQCSRNKDLRKNVTDLLEYKSEVKTYKDRNGELVDYNESLSTTVSELKMVNSALIDSVEKLKIKKPKTITEIVTKYEIKEIPIYYEDSIPCDPFKRRLALSNEFYDIGLTSNNKGVILDSLNVYNKSLIVVGEKKNGLFKRNEQIVVVQNSNPYVKTQGIKNYTIKPEVKWHDKLWFKASLFGLGVLTGTQISK